MPTYRLLIEYNGTDFHGWQIQPGERTVQEEIEKALQVALRQSVRLTGAGRTDAGVHARGQVAHFTTDDTIDPLRLRGSLNGLLDSDIAVQEVSKENDRFHSRFDATERIYVYQISTRPRALDVHMRLVLHSPPDFSVMNDAAETLLGRHDFSAFCRTASETRNRICVVDRASWQAEWRIGDFRFVIAADRFLHGMVRAIVGTLLEIGRGKRPTNDIERIFERMDRREAGPAAPAKGLVLQEVKYDAEN
jgi:tRNA pseudouridine38-40 synthase